jgi:hypothetical protein
MKEKGKNNKSELHEFFRYVRGEMTQREENRFQRKLQKDPFAEEAVEGFSGLSGEAMEKDLNSLEKRLKARVVPGNRFIYYRIAASVAVLMIISSVYFIVSRHEQPGESGEIPVNRITMDIPESQAIKETETAMLQDNLTALDETTGKKDETPETAQPAGQTNTDTPVRLAEEIPEEVTVTELKAEEQVILADNADDKAAPAPVMNEAIVVGYGAVMKSSKSVTAAENKAAFREPAYNPPLPVDGMESFNKYIEENSIKPDTIAIGETAVVVVNFIVRSTGAIDSLNAISSPGLSYSDEAKRLLREGPKWNPAERDGRKIDDEVTLRIVFK